MVRLPLDAYIYRVRSSPDIVVDLNDERYAVVLSVELESGECSPSLPGALAAAPEQLGAADAATMDNTNWASARNLELAAQLDAARAEIEELRRRIVDSQDHPSAVDRTLTPDEARALAAVLAHYADEAERRR